MISWADRQTRLQGEDDVIENNDSLEALVEATERLHKKFLKLEGR
ncbi:MAG: hypothetical protein ABW084_15040 [Candidatus Thiodiazotropha sp.]